MSKLLLCDYDHSEQYREISAKYDEEMDTERSTGENDGF